MYSMQSYYDCISKMKYMEEIFHAQYPNYWKKKKFMKSNLSSNIDDEVEDTNTISNGKATPSQKQRGKMNQCFPTMETCCSYIKYAIKFDVSDQPSQHVSLKNEIHTHPQTFLDSQPGKRPSKPKHRLFTNNDRRHDTRVSIYGPTPQIPP